MANAEHLALLQQGTKIWNGWRKRNPGSLPELNRADLGGANLSLANLSKADLSSATLKRADLRWAELNDANLSRANLRRARLFEGDLSGANFLAAKLRGADLRGADLSKADLSKADLREADLRQDANLRGAILRKADLREANLTGANLDEANLTGANLDEANLTGASLTGANLTGASLEEVNLLFADLTGAILGGADLTGASLLAANLSGADLREANLNHAQLIRTDISYANLTGSSIYGIAAWDLKLTSDTRQENLIITPPDEPAITVDNIKVAQFIYLLVNNEEIRDVIDTITSKAVLILGRFTLERKKVLDALQAALRKRGFVPITFDFDRPTNKDFSETMMILAGMSCFIIADITNPKSSPLELQATVPNYRIPFIPIIQRDEEPFSMFRDLHHKYDWVLPPLSYDSSAALVARLKNAIIVPALEMRGKLALKKAQELPTRSVSDYPEDDEF